MFKKLSIAAAALSVAAMVFSTFAPAVSADTPPDSSVALGGRGVLTASGTGVAAVRGLIDYQATATDGILLVKDVAGNATVNVTNTQGQARWRGFTVYFGFQSASITGTDVGVVVVGENVSLTVFGRGWAYLKGNGTYSVNGGPAKPWSEDGMFAGIAPAPSPTATP